MRNISALHAVSSHRLSDAQAHTPFSMFSHLTWIHFHTIVGKTTKKKKVLVSFILFWSGLNEMFRYYGINYFRNGWSLVALKTGVSGFGLFYKKSISVGVLFTILSDTYNNNLIFIGRSLKVLKRISFQTVSQLLACSILDPHWFNWDWKNTLAEVDYYLL